MNHKRQARLSSFSTFVQQPTTKHPLTCSSKSSYENKILMCETPTTLWPLQELIKQICCTVDMIALFVFFYFVCTSFVSMENDQKGCWNDIKTIKIFLTTTTMRPCIFQQSNTNHVIDDKRCKINRHNLACSIVWPQTAWKSCGRNINFMALLFAVWFAHQQV